MKEQFIAVSDIGDLNVRCHAGQIWSVQVIMCVDYFFIHTWYIYIPSTFVRG